MPPTWKQSDVFPIIARIIRDEFVKNPRFITHNEITACLLADTDALDIIANAYRQNDEKRSLEWLSHNMVAWFSQRSLLVNQNGETCSIAKKSTANGAIDSKLNSW